MRTCASEVVSGMAKVHRAVYYLDKRQYTATADYDIPPAV